MSRDNLIVNLMGMKKIELSPIIWKSIPLFSDISEDAADFTDKPLYIGHHPELFELILNALMYGPKNVKTYFEVDRRNNKVYVEYEEDFKSGTIVITKADYDKSINNMQIKNWDILEKGLQIIGAYLGLNILKLEELEDYDYEEGDYTYLKEGNPRIVIISSSNQTGGGSLDLSQLRNTIVEFLNENGVKDAQVKFVNPPSEFSKYTTVSKTPTKNISIVLEPDDIDGEKNFKGLCLMLDQTLRKSFDGNYKMNCLSYTNWPEEEDNEEMDPDDVERVLKIDILTGDNLVEVGNNIIEYNERYLKYGADTHDKRFNKFEIPSDADNLAFRNMQILTTKYGRIRYL